MTQYAPDGRLMFLHTNLSPKWNLEIPGNFSLYRRRWKVRPLSSAILLMLGPLAIERRHNAVYSSTCCLLLLCQGRKSCLPF